MVAGGVETVGQLAQLRFHGCGLAQGYLLGAPQPAIDVEHLILGDDTPDRLVAGVGITLVE